jgi:membrane-associated phospholipid phosphatase
MQNLLTRVFGPFYTRSLDVLAILVIVLLALMITVALTNTNIPLFLIFNRLSHYTGGGVWANLTSLGEGLIVLSLAGLIAIRWPKAAWTVLVAGVFGTLLVHGIKEAVGALRPAMILPRDSFTIIGPRLNVVSFPSGHTTTITAFATILYLQVKDARVAWLLLPVVVLVGISRMAVGAHWPMDVLGGWVVGILIAVFSYILAERWRFGVRAPAQFGIVLLSLLCAASLFWLAPQMKQALVLRWTVGSLGLITGIWALLVTYRRAKTAPAVGQLER